MILQKWRNPSALIADLSDHLQSLLNMKSRPSDEIVGVDIGADQLKIMKINRSESNIVIETYSTKPMPASLIAKDEEKDYPIIADTLKEMLSDAGIKTNKVAIAIPRSKAIFKNITVDSRLTPDELESRAWIEANKHFPDLVGDIYLDFYVNKSAANDSTQMDMTLVACRKDQIKPYLDILQLAGLQAKIVDVDSYALERALPFVCQLTNPNEVTALLSINTNMTTLIVMEGSHLVYAHDQGFDGQRLLAQTSAYLKDHGHVENAVSAGQNAADSSAVTQDTYTSILRDCLLSHLRHTIHFFYTSRANVSIHKLILAGDCATIKGLAPFIQTELGMDTLIADLSNQLSLKEGMDPAEFKLQSPALMLVCGLALSKLE